MIKLKYDTLSSAKKFEIQFNFRILYWAAFIGRQDIVDKVLRMGYSPFIEAHDKKSAVFAAIEGDKPGVLSYILQFSYIPTDERLFQKSKLNKDKYGNTAFH